MFSPVKGTEILIDGPAGKLQLLAAGPKENPAHKVAVICHPNPYFEGTMDNKVVTTLHRTFQDLGMSTVRFNFRGVGKSEGANQNVNLHTMTKVLTGLSKAWEKRMILWLC